MDTVVSCLHRQLVATPSWAHIRVHFFLVGAIPYLCAPRGGEQSGVWRALRFLFLIITLDPGPRRHLSIELSDTKVYGPEIRARLGTAAHFCKVVGLELRT